MRSALLACWLMLIILASAEAKPRQRVRCDQVRCVVDRAYRQELLEHEDELGRTYDVRPVMREGELDGFELTAVQPKSPFWLVGLRPGDVIRAINDIRLDDAGRVLSARTAVRYAGQLRVSLIRHGRPFSLTIDFE